MLHAPTSGTQTEFAYAKRASALMPSAKLRPSELKAGQDLASRKADRPGALLSEGFTHLQTTYGNQAILRSLNSSIGSKEQFLRRKCDCGTRLPPSPRTHELGPDEEETDRYSDQGVLLTLAGFGSGTCINGGAESGCDMDDGVYKIVRTRNTCCTKDCTLKHEQVHIKDVTSWGCCKAASVAYNKKDADQQAVKDKYNKWLNSVRTLTECNAHKTSVACADKLKKDKDCDGAGKETDCCKDIDQYRDVYASKVDVFCNAAPKDPPPCPAF